MQVPGVSLVNHAGKPEVYGANDVTQPHGGALREVSKLMGQGAGELAHVERRNQRQADGEDQILAEETSPAAPVPGSGVEVAVQVNAPGHGRAHDAADPLDEAEQERFGAWIQRVGLGAR